MNPQTVFPANFKPVNLRAVCAADEAYLPGITTGEAATGEVADVFITGEIGGWWGVAGGDVYASLAGKDLSLINVWLSSAGGGIFEAFQIYELLAGHPAPVHVYIFSLAASSGTIVASAGDKRIISKQSMYMIHEGASYLRGYYQVKELNAEANLLGKLNNRITDVYQRLTDMDESQIKALMAREEWMEPAEALEAGFVDEVVDVVNVPFEHANLTNSLYNEYFFEHTAAFMQKQLKPRGFSKMAASAITSIKQRAGGDNNYFNSSKSKIMFEDLGKRFFNLLAGNGFKVLDKDGNEVTASAGAKKIASAAENDQETTDLLGDAMRTQITDLVAQVIAKNAPTGGEANGEVLETFKTINNKLKELTNEISQLKGAGADGQTLPETVAKQQSELEMLRQDMLNTKVAKAGAVGASADNSGQNLDQGAGETGDKRIAFGKESSMYKTMIAQGLVNANQIAAIERSVNAKRQNQG